MLNFVLFVFFSFMASQRIKRDATEALKLILGIGRPLTDRLLDFDAKKTLFREIKVKRNPKCALCGEHPTITELFDDGDPFAGCAVRP